MARQGAPGPTAISVPWARPGPFLYIHGFETDSRADPPPSVQSFGRPEGVLPVLSDPPIATKNVCGSCTGKCVACASLLGPLTSNQLPEPEGSGQANPFIPIQLNPRSHWPSSHPVEPIAPSLAHPKNKMRPAAPHKCTRTNRIFASGLNTLASPRAPRVPGVRRPVLAVLPAPPLPAALPSPGCFISG